MHLIKLLQATRHHRPLRYAYEDWHTLKHLVLGPAHELDGTNYAPLMSTDDKALAQYVVHAANHLPQVLRSLNRLMVAADAYRSAGKRVPAHVSEELLSALTDAASTHTNAIDVADP
jgi:hypothetical protein